MSKTLLISGILLSEFVCYSIVQLTSQHISELVSIANEAGQKILEVYLTDDLGVNFKNDHSPLTIADQKSHEYISIHLKKHFPEIELLSEEGKEIPLDQRKDWTLFWLVDPLDGTKEFIKRNGEFTVNIALIDNDTPVFGIIHVPVSGETFYGGPDYGSYKTDRENNRIKLSVVPKENKLTVVQSRSHSSVEEGQFYANYDIAEKVSKGSSLKICMVAEGKAQLYFRGGPTWEWDTAAGHAILLGAGGYFINKDYSPLVYNKEIIKNYGFIASAMHL